MNKQQSHPSLPSALPSYMVKNEMKSENEDTEGTRSSIDMLSNQDLQKIYTSGGVNFGFQQQYQNYEDSKDDDDSRYKSVSNQSASKIIVQTTSTGTKNLLKPQEFVLFKNLPIEKTIQRGRNENKSVLDLSASNIDIFKD